MHAARATSGAVMRNYEGRATRNLHTTAPLQMRVRVQASNGITPMPGWHKYSPDLNPQESVWSWAEKALRKKEQKSDTFTIFCRKLLRVARRYPSAASLIPSMAKRVQAVLKHGDAMTKY